MRCICPVLLVTALLLCLTGSVVADAQERIARVRDEARNSPWAGGPLACYVVPAMNSVKRLPDVIPADGKLGDQLNVVAAKGEFEPVSFVVFPFQDLAELEVTATALAGAQGTIPASAVDLKVVKCWYQAGTAWHSYFADPTRRELTPELLLNDENLVKVDRKTKDNYLRVDYPEGSEYVWGKYRKARQTQETYWKDEELGGPEFWDKVLKPSIERLNGYGEKMKTPDELTAQDAEFLFKNTIGNWMEFDYLASELRREYLEKRLMTP